MRTDEPSRFNVNADDLRKYPWNDLINRHSSKECWSYCQAFGKAADECRDIGDDLGERVYSFLNVVASFHAVPNSRTSPYRSMWQKVDGTRSLIPDDLTDLDLDALQAIVHEVEDPEFRARVADILWVCRKDYKSAKIAVSAFLESAERLKTDDLWPPYIDRLDRAAQISAKKGFETECKAVADGIESAIIEFENNPKSGLLCNQLMRILLMLKKGDADQCVALSERLANEFQKLSEWHFAEAYWQMAESWHRQAGNQDEMQRCQIKAAECNILRAEEGLEKDPPQHGYAANWMGRGLEGLRRARADASRIKEVHTKLLSLQKLSLSELKPLGIDPELIPEFKENRKKVQTAAVAHVSGLDFEKTILRFVHIEKPTEVAALEENERKNSEGMIWDKICGSSRLDRDGKVAEIMPASGFSEDSDQAAFRMKLVQSASMFHWPLAVDWRIEPARLTIAQEHSIRLNDLDFLVMNNPFIPSGHEGIYRRGIQAGFFGDWLIAMHLLIPQLEASLRYVLQQYGVVTSTFEPDGTQKERDINQLLRDPKTEEIFGPNILFDLRGILIERLGCNMRNESAHGLMHESAFYRPESVYLWWLVIHICWLGYKSTPENPSKDI